MVRCFLLFALLGALPRTAPAGTEAAGAPVSLLAGPDGTAWRDLGAQLAAQDGVAGTFTERRWFSVRKEPVVVSGELRLSRERGLSLHYAEQGGRTMIVDAVGVLLRDDRGRSRAVPADSPAAGFAVWLLPMLRFDFAVLEKAFVVTGAREGEAWRLDLVPREGDLARALRGLAISGTGERVQHITIDRGEKRRVEIEMGDVRTGVTFGADEIGTYFRPDRR